MKKITVTNITPNIKMEKYKPKQNWRLTQVYRRSADPTPLLRLTMLLLVKKIYKALDFKKVS